MARDKSRTTYPGWWEDPDYWKGGPFEIPPYAPPKGVPDWYKKWTPPIGSPPPRQTGTGGGGEKGKTGGGGEKKTTWDVFDFRPPGAPSWWKALKPSEFNELTTYLASVNMLIPFLSPEDQRTVAAQLYITDPEHFGHLNPEALGVPPLPPQGYQWEDTRRWMMSADRAKAALEALTALLRESGKSEKDMGAGYAFLKTLAATVGQYGSNAKDVMVKGMTRTDMQRMLAALDPLLGMTEGQALSPYGPIAKAFAFPFLYGKPMMPFTRTAEGRYMFGSPFPKFRF